MKAPAIWTLFVLLMTFAANVAAATELRVDDPNGLLDRVDQFVGHVPFEQAFKCGSYVEVSKKGKRARATIEQCTADQVTFVTIPGENSRSDKGVISRAEYEANKGNMLRGLVKSMTGSVAINGRPTEVFIQIDNPEELKLELENGQSVEAIAVDVNLMSPGIFGIIEKAITFRVTVARNVPALAQLARLFSAKGQPAEQHRLLGFGDQVPASRRGD